MSGKNSAIDGSGMNLNVAERRGYPRIRLQIPLFIRGSDESGVEFLELAKTLDISSKGARIVCPHPLRQGELISLTIPAPIPSSPISSDSGTPPIHARVQRVESTGGMEVAAVEFLKSIE
jgi:PilZ domain